MNDEAEKRESGKLSGKAEGGMMKRKSDPSTDSASSPPRSEQRRGARTQDQLGNRETGEVD